MTRANINSLILGLVRSDAINLNVRQIAVLFCVDDLPRQSVKHLARTLQINGPAVCRAVDRLVTKGLVKRGDASDGRMVEITTTERGAIFVQRAVQAAA